MFSWSTSTLQLQLFHRLSSLSRFSANRFQQFRISSRHMSSHTPDAWKPQQYHLFSDVRTRPGLELLARIPDISPCNTVVDLGCGTGRFTVPLAQRFSSASVIGIDTSQAMLSSAQATIDATKDATLMKRVQFQTADAATWKPSTPVDILYSNAALHWLPDHSSLIPHLLQQVRSGGYFAWQIPDNFDAPSHTIMHQLIFEGGYHNTDEMKAVLDGWPQCEQGPLLTYYDMMEPYASYIDAWHVEYAQVLTGKLLNDGKDGNAPVYHPVLEFTKGSSFSPVLMALPNDAARASFQLEYSRRLEREYPIRRHINDESGMIQTIFPFKRVFFVAQRK